MKLLVPLAALILSLVGQASPDVPGWLQNVSDLGLVIFLIAVMYGGIKDKPWWVTGREYRDALRREERMTQLALHATRAGETTADTLRKAVNLDDTL